MSDVTRLIATAFIWTAIAFIVFLASSSVSGGDMIGVMIVVMIGAASGTHSVWSSRQAAQSAGTEKAKRHRAAHAASLVNSLSDDEIDELRSRLMLNEQPVPLEALLHERDRQEKR